MSSGGKELIIPSIFLESDPKRHMSINLENGLWQCFKTKNKGNFLKLYSVLEGISYRTAYEHFLFRSLEDAPPEEEVVVETTKKVEESLPELIRIDKDQVPTDYLGLLAFELLCKRRIWDETFDNIHTPFYICKEGTYANRLVIPYLNGNKMFFFQGRDLIGRDPKYLNSKNIKSSHILYPFDYSSTKNLYVCEGVFDALSLKQLGLNATSTISCNVSKEQMSQLKEYQGKIVLAYDRDKAGTEGLKRFDMIRRQLRMSNHNLLYVQPKPPYKDWNEMLVKESDSMLDYIKSNTMYLDEITIALSSL